MAITSNAWFIFSMCVLVAAFLILIGISITKIISDQDIYYGGEPSEGQREYMRVVRERNLRWMYTMSTRSRHHTHLSPHPLTRVENVSEDPFEQLFPAEEMDGKAAWCQELHRLGGSKVPGKKTPK